MARNTQVAADHNAPPITRILAEFVADHPSRGWSDAVDHEAHRTFLNWLGCAVGAAQPRGGRGRAGRRAGAAARRRRPPCSAARERVDMASAALLNGISSHTFDFDDTHLKTIIHPAGPVASARAGAGRAHRRERPRRDRRAGARHRRGLPPRQHRCTPSTTTAAGTSPAPPACWARPPAARACWGSTRDRPRWRSASRPRSRSACASSSAP